MSAMASSASETSCTTACVRSARRSASSATSFRSSLSPSSACCPTWHPACAARVHVSTCRAPHPLSSPPPQSVPQSADVLAQVHFHATPLGQQRHLVPQLAAPVLRLLPHLARSVRSARPRQHMLPSPRLPMQSPRHLPSCQRRKATPLWVDQP